MSVERIEIDGRKFNVAKAPANKQKTLLSLIGARIAFVSASKGEEIDVALLVGSLLTLPESDFDAVADIVLFKVVENGKDTPIDVGDFQDQITMYYRLVAEAIKLNLGDFFTYLGTENASRKAAGKSQ